MGEAGCVFFCYYNFFSLVNLYQDKLIKTPPLLHPYNLRTLYTEGICLLCFHFLAHRKGAAVLRYQVHPSLVDGCTLKLLVLPTCCFLCLWIGGVCTSQSIEMTNVAVERLTSSPRGKPTRFLAGSLSAAENCQVLSFGCVL